MEPFPFLNSIRTKTHTSRGFTLVEMLVVLAIITVISVITIAGQTTFNRSLLLTETAYTIAFSIREAQTLGLSSRVFGGVQNAGYGIRFNIASPKSYTEYSDIVPSCVGGVCPTYAATDCPGHSASTGPDGRPGDCLFTNATETVRTYSLNRGYYVSRFCGTTSSGSTECSGVDYDTLDIVFMRPATSATIIGKKTVGSPKVLTDATIYLNSPDAVAQRCIYVTKVGQISVKNCP